MLVIRMQRTGRSGHAQFRVVVQDSRRTPTSGKIVAALGHFNPHTKETSLNKEKASFYLEHGAQPSERVIRLLKSEGVKMPKWVDMPDKKKGNVRHPEKRRSTRPDEPKVEAPAETVSEAATEAEPETPASEKETAAEAEPDQPAETETAVASEEPVVAEVATGETSAETEPTVEAPGEPVVTEAPEEEAPAKTEKA